MCVCLTFPQTARAESSNNAYLESIMNFIQENYKDDVDADQLGNGAIQGMFNNLDDYSEFFSPDEAESFLSEMNGEYIGIGIMMAKVDDHIIVTKVFAPSPAQEAGLMSNDIIVKIDGINAIGISMEEASNMIMGKAGSKVELDILRDTGSELLQFEIERAAVQINPVTYEIYNDIGYLKIDTFNTNAGSSLNTALEGMDNQGIKKIILDLRGNPGGEVSQAIEVARQFVPAGLIAKLDYKSPNYADDEYYSYLAEPKYQLVVLVDRMSASASEILAGAIQDTRAGVLVGSQTYGKSKVQQLFPILSQDAFDEYRRRLKVEIVDAYELINTYNIMPSADEIVGWVKITTGEYFTPNGRSIDGIGLTPDVFLANYYSDAEILEIHNVGKLSQTKQQNLYGESIDVYYAEKILRLLGYDIDSPDMILDPSTFNAISDFQASQGLYTYGILDLSTQQALNNELYQQILKIDKPYATAVELLSQ